MDATSLVVLVGKPAVWVAIVFAATMGGIAFASPRLFQRVATVADRRYSLQSLVAYLEQRSYDVDCQLMPHVRIVGISALAAAASVALLISQGG